MSSYTTYLMYVSCSLRFLLVVVVFVVIGISNKQTGCLTNNSNNKGNNNDNRNKHKSITKMKNVGKYLCTPLLTYVFFVCVMTTVSCAILTVNGARMLCVHVLSLSQQAQSISFAIFMWKLKSDVRCSILFLDKQKYPLTHTATTVCKQIPFFFEFYGKILQELNILHYILHIHSIMKYSVMTAKVPLSHPK